MLDNLSKYIYEIYRSKSVSAAAQKLYISQPALSAAVKKAEQELGAAIFNRKTIPFTLTAEGKLYIESIEKMMQLEQRMKEQIQNISDINGGTINIATYTNFSIFVLPKICAKFHEKYPDVDINLSITTEDLPEMLTKNTADIIFIFNEECAPGFKIVPLLEENLIVMARRDTKGIEHILDYALTHEQIVNRSYSDDDRIGDVSEFKDVEFIYYPPNCTAFRKRKLIFGDVNLSGHIYPKNYSHRLNYNLMKEGFGAILTTDADIATMFPGDDCIYFALKNPDSKQSFSLAYDATEDSPAYKLIYEFIKASKEFFECENPLKKVI
ncbi:MAG: LysR family transcriptional regulator [Clostridia bacterium]|nr:LysR family transcriptional regulator [Clostridia bacterium]